MHDASLSKAGFRLRHSRWHISFLAIATHDGAPLLDISFTTIDGSRAGADAKILVSNSHRKQQKPAPMKKAEEMLQGRPAAPFQLSISDAITLLSFSFLRCIFILKKLKCCILPCAD